MEWDEIYAERVRRATRGIIQHPIESVGDFDVRLTDIVIKCDTSGGNKTVTLPRPQDFTGRFLYVIKSSGDANSVTIDGDGSNINGSGTLVSSAAYTFVVLFSLGTAWAASRVWGVQGATVADASGGGVVDAEARTAINTLLARLRTLNVIAS